MTDRAQFEAMLEALINEDQETAKEIFHNIVVGKSREIYEELLESDFNQDSGNPYKKHEEEEEEEESVGDEEGEEEPEDDAEDDGEEDGEEPAFGDEEGEEDGEGEGDIEDRVMDLEDALEDLKAEFEQLLQGEEHEEEMDPGHHGDVHAADIEADLMGAGEHEEEEEEGVMHHVHHHMNEYVNKVPLPKHGDNGVNTKSTIDNMKNDMGGSAKNIAQSFSTTSGGTQGGLASPKVTPNPDAAGNLNVPGGNAGKKGFTKKEPGHGPEKKGAGEKSVSAKSLISTKVR